MPLVSFDFNFWTVLFCLLNFSFSAYVLITARSSALVTKIHTLEVDVATLKANQANAIKHDDLAAVYKRLDDVSKIVNKIDGQIEEISKRKWGFFR